MQDTIIKGTGNSRTLASVPNFLTLYPTYEAFAQALVNKELPIDLGPLNPAGVQAAGTDLTKTNLLKDLTAAAYGLPGTAVPDEVLAKARTLIAGAQATGDAKGYSAFGSYTGNSQDTVTLNFPFPVQYLIVFGYSSPGTRQYAFMFASKALSQNWRIRLWSSSVSNGLGFDSITVIFGDASVTWNESTHYLNETGNKYGYAAFG